MIVYKIKRKSDGLYSTGGWSPGFHKNGKIWNSKGTLKNHLRIVDRRIYKDCHILEYTITEECIDTLFLEDLFNEIDQKEKQKEEENKKREEDRRNNEVRKFLEQNKDIIDTIYNKK